LPLARCPCSNSIRTLSFGRMDAVCQFCGAKHWLAERVSGSASSPMFSQCCHRGKVVLHPLPAPPLAIQSLLTDQTSQARHFRRHICQYNSCFAFTSFRTSENDIVHNSRGPWTWKTCIYLSKKNNVVGIVSKRPPRGQLSYKESTKKVTSCSLGWCATGTMMRRGV